MPSQPSGAGAPCPHPYQPFSCGNPMHAALLSGGTRRDTQRPIALRASDAGAVSRSTVPLATFTPNASTGRPSGGGFDFGRRLGRGILGGRAWRTSRRRSTPRSRLRALADPVGAYANSRSQRGKVMVVRVLYALGRPPCDARVLGYAFLGRWSRRVRKFVGWLELHRSRLHPDPRKLTQHQTENVCRKDV